MLMGEKKSLKWIDPKGYIVTKPKQTSVGFTSLDQDSIFCEGKIQEKKLTNKQKNKTQNKTNHNKNQNKTKQFF